MHKRAISHFFSSPLSVTIAAFVVIFIQIADISGGNSWAINFNERNSLSNLAFYSGIIVVSIFIQVYFLKNSTRIVFGIKKATSRKALIVAYLYIVIHLTVIILLSYLLAQQLITFKYSIITVELIIGFSYLVSVVMLVTLAIKCFKTYFLTKSKMAGVYGIAIFALSLQLVCASFYLYVNLNNKPLYIDPDRNPSASYYSTSLSNTLFSLYDSTKIISFFAIWFSSILLTKSFAQKIGKLKYCFIVSIPVIYFLFQYVPILLNQLGIFNSIIMEEGTLYPFIYNFIFNTANVGTGILFGITFFLLSRTIAYENLRYYLTICGAGIMIIFSTSVSTILILSAFPAWGVISITFVLPASFLILIGLDSATFYVAEDTKVRSYLSRNKTQFELFKALGSAKASAQAQQKIHQIIEQIHSNIETEALFSSKSETEDINQYVGDVIAELKRAGKLDGTKSNNKPNG